MVFLYLHTLLLSQIKYPIISFKFNVLLKLSFGNYDRKGRFETIQSDGLIDSHVLFN